MSSTEAHPSDVEVAPELAGLELADIPDGPAAATFLAAGIGVFTLGLLTTLAVINGNLKDFLADFQGSVGVGPLAGKTIVSVVVWAVAWLVLSLLWWRRDVDVRKAFWIGLVLGVLGAIGTFPTFFEAFE